MERFNVKKRSFYISLGVCALAISAAGWSTYNSIKDFSNSSHSSESPSTIIRKKKKSAEEIPKMNLKNSLEKSVYNSNEENLKEVSANGPEFIVPIEYSELKQFDDDLSYSEKFQDWRTSDGIDFKGKSNSDISSASNGKVEEIFDDPSYGSTVKIKSSSDGKDVMVYYSELDPESISVSKGDKIIQGQKIAKTKDDILHFAIQNGNEFIDPSPILGISK